MRLWLLIALFASLVFTRVFLGFASGKRQEQPPETVFPACFQLSAEKALKNTREWKCVYGGEENFEQGFAFFWSDVGLTEGTYWHRVAAGEGRQDPETHYCGPGAYLSYGYTDYPVFGLQAAVYLRGCGKIICKGKLDTEVFSHE